MMPAIMLYVLLIAGLLGTAGLVTERIFTRMGWATRGIWLASLLASLALPAYAMIANQTAVSPTRESTLASEHRTIATDEPDSIVTAAQRLALPDWSRWPLFNRWYEIGRPSWRGLDRPLTIFWIASTSIVLIIYCAAWFALSRAMRNWRAGRISGSDVLISRHRGPAVIGLVQPRLVVPQWLMAAPADVQAFVLRHEHEHITARDQVLLVAGLLLVAAAPWNIALWWQLRRLRAAIEIDCDRRVVRAGTDPAAYARILFKVGQRHAGTPWPAVGVTEPVSLLERRIRLVIEGPGRARRALAILGTVFAIALIVAACAVDAPRPSVPAATDTAGPDLGGPRQSVTGMTQGRDRVVIVVDVSASMTSVDPEPIDRSREQRNESAKWRKLVDTVAQLTEQIRGRYQIVAYSDDAHAVLPGTDGRWLTAGDGDLLADALGILRDETAPRGASNLHAALTAAAALQPPVEHIYLITDGLPTSGPFSGRPEGLDDERVARFESAIAVVPPSARVNVILLPRAGDLVAAPAFWTLALRTGGSLFAPTIDTTLAGVSLDSEYLAFVIDTSGSMRQFAWDDIRNHMTETLAAYPNVKGLQVLSGEGELMFPQYGSGWIANSPARRGEIIDALEGWRAFSDSNPSDGVLAAIDSLYGTEDQVAIYVYGDDLANGTVSDALAAINDRNALNGGTKVRIHAVAFPVYYEVTGSLLTSAGYAALMRDLAQRNGGSFIGLTAN